MCEETLVRKLFYLRNSNSSRKQSNLNLHMLQTLYLTYVSLRLLWQKDFSFHMTKLLFVNWEWGKLRLQFCVGEPDVTAGAVVALPPCCPLSCIGSGIYLILCWAVSGCELSRKLLVACHFYFYFFSSGYFSASWAHWNQLSAGSDKHWNQHKKGQYVDCRKDVISFISLGC